MSVSELIVRKRNSVATRAALLAAATAHFARESYDNVSLREIAADAGVDVALVSRYFGGKEELFEAVLAACPPPESLFEGEPHDFGERVACMLVDEPQENEKLDIVLVMLRSASSPSASDAIRRSGEERFYGPLARWLGGPHARERARLAGAIIMGAAIDRRIDEDFGLSPKERRRFRNRLARSLQTAVDP
jgi:hypothetical protein